MSVFEAINAASYAWQPTAFHQLYASTTPYYTHLWTTSIVACVLPSFAYTIITRNKNNFQKANSILSLLHAVLGVTAGWYSLMTARDALYSHDGWSASFDLVRATICDLSSGFFVYDLIYSLYKKQWDQAIHHFLCAFSMSYCRGADVGSKELIAAMCISEISTPVMHVRRFLEYTKSWPGFNPFDWASLAFAVTFLTCRCILTPFVAYKTVVLPENPWVLRICGGAVQLLSFAWAFRIINIMRKALKGDKSASNNCDTFQNRNKKEE
eukprot:GDKJ01005153.1.p1 GENE.GDKJ01005153.1~~GDKJ01005153.1.p1  ORF type:complete len:268 (+),score=49.55 GDKJ01005153.1:24-827(+)